MNDDDKSKVPAYDNSVICQILMEFQGKKGVRGSKSIRALAEEVGISEATLRRWRDTNTKPKIDLLYKFANAVGLSITEVLGESDRYKQQLDEIHELLGPIADRLQSQQSSDDDQVSL